MPEKSGKKRDLMQFFEGGNEQLSMTRLLCFMSWFPATWTLVKSPSENILGWYLGAYVLGYIGGKAADVGAAMVNKKATE